MDNRIKEKNLNRRTVTPGLLAMLTGLVSMPTFVQEALRIGLVAPFAGPYADYRRQMEAGIWTYLNQHAVC
jgi:branched-chain amino acid transport system substrate-binding protein